MTLPCSINVTRDHTPNPYAATHNALSTKLPSPGSFAFVSKSPITDIRYVNVKGEGNSGVHRPPLRAARFLLMPFCKSSPMKKLRHANRIRATSAKKFGSNWYCWCDRMYCEFSHKRCEACGKKPHKRWRLKKDTMIE